MSDLIEIPPKAIPAINRLTDTLDGISSNPVRHLLLKGGRGSAKSHTVARVLVHIARFRPWRFLCTREIQKSLDESVYQLILDTIRELGYEDFFTATKTSIRGANGSEFLFAGLRSQDIEKVRSKENVKVCWCEEAHVLSEKSLDVLAPTIRAENSVIIYSYNPELEDDPVHSRYALQPQDDVEVVTLNHRDNPWFPEVLRSELQRDYDRDKTEGRVKYNWIWEGQCLPAVEGAIFAAEVARFQEEGRLLPLEYDPKGKVHIVMDLGYGVMTAILVQKFASTVQIIGYKEMRHSTYHDLTRELEKHDYRWGKVWMPHDASHRDPKYGKSHFEVMEELGWKTDKIEQIGVENYIEAGRNLFSNLYMTNNAEGKLLLRSLKRWRYNVIETDTGAQKTNPPMKDEYSHGAEAFCYTAVVADELTNGPVISNPYRGFDSGYAA